MYTMLRARRWFGSLSVALLLTTAGCSSGGSKGSATGLASGTACVSVGGRPEVCASSGVTANRTVNAGYDIEISIGHHNPASTSDCFSWTDDEFSFTVTIPDGVPLPYQANNRPGSASFAASSCGYVTNTASVATGTIYQTATDGGLNVEGDVTIPYTIDNAMYQCGASCPASNSAHFRFNVPL